ncbi:MAG: thioredoxin family protein [Saprospiraceae bacterium]
MTYPIKYKNITTQTFAEVVVAQRQPTVLVFGTQWSGNSEIVDSMMERVSQKFNSDIQFFKVDLEEQANISNFFGVHSVPTIVLIKDGEVVERIEGFIPAKKVQKKIKETYHC